YYEQSSAGPLIERIKLPGLVVHALDDPFIPSSPFLRITFPPQLALELIPSGGHLGYLSRDPWGGDHHWLDARLSCWLSRRWNAGVQTLDDVRLRRGTSRERQGGQSAHVRTELQ